MGLANKIMNKTVPTYNGSRIIGVPMDFGQHHRGVDMGPVALGYSGLAAELRRLEYEVEDSGDLLVPVRDQTNKTARLAVALTVLALGKRIY